MMWEGVRAGKLDSGPKTRQISGRSLLKSYGDVEYASEPMQMPDPSHTYTSSCPLLHIVLGVSYKPTASCVGTNHPIISWRTTNDDVRFLRAPSFRDERGAESDAVSERWGCP